MHGLFTFLAFVVPLVFTQSTRAGLNTVAKAAGKLYFGTATNNAELTDIPYATILNDTNEFGQRTPAKTLKWSRTEPIQNTFTFAEGDQIVNTAKANGQIVRGHNLVWNSALPTWVTNGSWTNDTLIAAMQNHIANVAGRYAGQLYAWDVVNEPLNDDDGMFRSDVFFDTIGEAYIAIALRAARAADPTAKLYLNEYGIEGPGSKATGMINLIKSLHAQDVPIDGIGIESHLIVGELPSGIQENLEAITALGVEIAITELDIRMTLPPTHALLAQQKADYTTLISACNAIEKCVGVTVWDFTDKYSWIPGTFPGQGAACPWDENLILKPAYEGAIAGFA